MTEEEAERITRDVTQALAKAASGVGFAAGEPFPSGNASEGETGYVFEFEHEGHTYNVEVFGPTYEEEA